MFLFAGVVLAGLVVVGWIWNPILVPGCDDQRTKALVVEILTKQLELPATLTLTQISIRSGWLLGRRWTCEGQISGALGNGSIAQVRYTSTVTQDTHRQYVTARMMP